MRAYYSVLAVLALLSAPAFAATDKSNANQPSNKPADLASPPDHKYCLVSDGTTTDTRIHTRECRTKADWARRGVDIDELIKNAPEGRMR
jgi:UrcA family protein